MTGKADRCSKGCHCIRWTPVSTLPCRLNKSLSKQLQVAERRAGQLKEALTAKAAACKALTEQVQELHLRQSGLSAQSSFACLPDLFSEQSRTNGVDLAAAAAAAGPTAQSHTSTVQGGPLQSPTVNVAALQLELAKREADIERLQTALGKAIDGQRGQAECFASLTKQAQHTEQVNPQHNLKISTVAASARSRQIGIWQFRNAR